MPTMADVFEPKKRSEIMRAVKSRDTAPERLVVEALGDRSRFRLDLHDSSLPGAPDIVIRSRKIALFVHGCFWHGHTCKRGSRIPKTRRDYWTAKITGNRTRDRRTRRRLRRLGWHVFTVWECQLKADARDKTITRLLRQIRAT